MLRQLRILAGAALVALSLSACQQTTLTANPGLDAQLRAAGFTVSDSTPGGMPAQAYICPKARCGAVVIALRLVQEQTPPAGVTLTAEQTLRADVYKEAGARAVIQSIVAQRDNPKVTITSLKIVPAAAEIRLNMTMTGSDRPETLTGGAIVRARGNIMSMLMVFADKPGVAQRYLRNQWVP